MNHLRDEIPRRVPVGEGGDVQSRLGEKVAESGHSCWMVSKVKATQRRRKIDKTVQQCSYRHVFSLLFDFSYRFVSI